MKIVLASSFVPFINGGARFIVEWLEQKLIEHGHEVERFYLPFVDHPDKILEQITAFRLIDLSDSCDRLIAFRPPAYVLPHPNKVLWFIHHIRVFYDLWETEYRPVPDTPSGRALRKTLIELDTAALSEARQIFTNSQVVAERLARFNGVHAKPLYPPILAPERFFNAGYGDEIIFICRIEPHKRQELVVRAMQHVTTPVRLRICGSSVNPAYVKALASLVDAHKLQNRVTIEDRWISEDEKATRLSSALAVIYPPQDEDSYGYPSLEAAHSRKAVLTTMDAGGVLELIENERNGLVVEPEPMAIAAAMDRLYRDRAEAKRMGDANARRVSELNIDWTTVVAALTS